MTLDRRTPHLLVEALGILETSFSELPDFESPVDTASLRSILLETAERMKDNFPYPHPFYIGQMIKPPHAIARLAYALSLWINPNNHALDGGRCSSAMEKEAVAQIAAMFGWNVHLGRLTSGGTSANLEALWIAAKLRPGHTVVASAQAHYTHRRLCGVLGIPFEEISVDRRARMDMDSLKRTLNGGNIGTVVMTLGTPATGSVDSLHKALELQEEYDFRIHVDAAYGGYYCLAGNLSDDTQAAFALLPEADSIVVDPHKHGLQPYGCGCIIFRDPTVGKYYKHDSPYTYFTSTELHLGEISLECSRPGSSAVALWATQRLLPLVMGGKFAELKTCRDAALELFKRLERDQRFITAAPPELDIVVWGLNATSASGCSKAADRFFDAAAKQNIHLAKVKLPKSLLESYLPTVVWDSDHVTFLRSCVMKPEHKEWMERIWRGLARAAASLQKDE